MSCVLKIRTCGSYCKLLGLPQTHLANTAELERHLLTVCKTIEAKEHEGMTLFGIGIGEDRVRHFYKNAEVLKSVGELPRAVFKIVEGIARMKTNSTQMS